MTSELTNQLALAGLLHDIGKFMLRAAVHGNRVWDSEAKGDFGYKHAMLSAAFAERYLPEPWRGPVKNMAGNHHRPQTREDFIVSLADMLSAAERDDRTADENPRVQHPQQLLSIFSVLEAGGIKPSQSERLYLPLCPLALKRDVLFPQKAMAQRDVWSAYARLWQEFEREVEQLKAAHDQDPDLPSYLESLLLLTQRYLWCVPSAYYRSLPDISLYDHGRITAALAAVLNRDGVDDAILKRWRNSPKSIGENVALLVGGDISGVQEFIYTISSRGAAPTLRGRSFYLQVLTEALARYLLRSLELPATNMIYAGGGSFFLLARPEDADRLPDLQQEISRILFQQHRGELYVAVAGVPVAGREFMDGSISRKWDDVHEAMRRKKLRRFAELDDDLAVLFEPAGHGGNEEQLCQVCGQEHPQIISDPERPDSETVRKCSSCLEFEKLGDALRNARYLALDDIPPRSSLDLNQPAGIWRDTLAHLGMKIDVCAEAPEPAPETRRLLLALDDEDASSLRPLPRAVTGRRFLVNVAPILRDAELDTLTQEMTPAEREDLPRVPGGVKPFSVLAHQSNGIKRLGVLRMDVDDLGKLFQNGFGKHATFSRIAALSFAVSLYFEGWVSRLVEDARTGGRVYTIYSGGDDLFFVGSWDAMLELAIRIRADLTKYAAGHPGIHASAGVALVGGKYPLSQAAQDAEEAEKAAKNLVWWNEDRIRNEKDAIAFLAQPVPWQSFGLDAGCPAGLETAHGLMQTLVKLCSDRNRDTAAPRAFVRALIDIHRQYAEAQERWRKDHADSDWSGPQQIVLGPWAWRAAYTLQNLYKRSGIDEAQQLNEKLPASGYCMMEWLGVAAAWADLYIRRRE